MAGDKTGAVLRQPPDDRQTAGKPPDKAGASASASGSNAETGGGCAATGFGPADRAGEAVQNSERESRRSRPPLVRDDAWNAACCAAAQQIAARAYDMTLTQMLSKKRGRAWQAEGRQVAMYLAHVIGQVPPSDAAPHFGRDRTTIGHACARIEDRRDEDWFDTGLSGLEAQMLQRLGEMKLQRLLAAEARHGDRDHEITVETPVVVRTARGRFYLFEPVDPSGPVR